MDDGYIGQRTNKKWLLPLTVIAVVVGVSFLIFFFLINKEKMVSPIPSKPSFEVIFYTPTPGAATPTSTPSATPKVKKAPTVVPTIKIASPSPTIKATVTPK